VVALLAGLSGIASGQPAAGAPTLATLDRQNGATGVGAALGWAPIDDIAFAGGGSVVRLDLFGEYVAPNGLGGYGMFALSALSADELDATAPSNLEAGGVYAIHGGANDYLFRLGATLPLAASSDDDGAFANFISAYLRPTDFALAWPRTVWLRASASPILRWGQAFLRIDGGVDVAVAAMDDELDSPDPLLRLNLGGGLDTGALAVAGELSAITGLGDDDDVGIYEQDVATTAAVSAYLRGHTLEPGVAVGMPLDSDVRDLMALFVVASLQARLQ